MMHDKISENAAQVSQTRFMHSDPEETDFLLQRRWKGKSPRNGYTCLEWVPSKTITSLLLLVFVISVVCFV